ncbi:MAG: hypothetical protein L3J89_09640 [Gammaproteobacteria bacterium]|nr:hypothetical protein [Gammaproteobacteria bacterium]
MKNRRCFLVKSSVSQKRHFSRQTVYLYFGMRAERLIAITRNAVSGVE